MSVLRHILTNNWSIIPRLLPKHSWIDASQFVGMKELAAYLLRLKALTLTLTLTLIGSRPTYSASRPTIRNL